MKLFSGVRAVSRSSHMTGLAMGWRLSRRGQSGGVIAGEA
jgi:hypothetical protein